MSNETPPEDRYHISPGDPTPVKYTLGCEIQSARELWPIGSTVYAVDIGGIEPEILFDIFLTNYPQAASLGSHVPRVRTKKKFMRVEDGVLTLSQPGDEADA